MSVEDSTLSSLSLSHAEVIEAGVTSAARLLRRAIGEAAQEYLQKAFKRSSGVGDFSAELKLIAEERKRADAFLDAMSQRLDTRLQSLIHAPITPQAKKVEWDKAIAMETINLDRHLAAVRDRLRKALFYYQIRATNLRGALWKLGPTKTHTPDCVYMAGKAWTWKVLDDINPYTRHTGCACSLVPIPPGMKVLDSVGPDFFLLEVEEARFARFRGFPVAIERSLIARLRRQQRAAATRLVLHGHYVRRGSRWVFVRARRPIDAVQAGSTTGSPK